MQGVVSLGATKEAALYFDRVFPNDFMYNLLRRSSFIDDSNLSVPFDSDNVDQSILESLLPGVPDPVKLWGDYIAVSSVDALVAVLVKDPDSAEILIPEIQPRLERLNSRLGTSATIEDVFKDPHEFKRLIGILGLKLRLGCGFSDELAWIDKSLLEKSLVIYSGGSPDRADLDIPLFAVTLSELQLIDASKIEWQHVVEFRKDRESKRALRDFRLFFQENFHGKSSEYISDKLAQISEDYEKTARLWGFATVMKSLSTAFDNGAILAGSAGALASILAGAPLAVTAAAGVTLPLGKGLIEFASIAIDASKERARNPVRYLTHLSRLGKMARSD